MWVWVWVWAWAWAWACACACACVIYHLLHRFCAVIHVLFNTINFFFESTNMQLVIPQVTKETATVAKALVEYFANQRRVMNKVIEVITC